MRKILVLSAFLASSTLYVFSQGPSQALAMLGASGEVDISAAQAKQDGLLAQANLLEATIAALENASDTAVATVASAASSVKKTILPAPRPKSVATTAAAKIPASTSIATATSALARTSPSAPVPAPAPVPINPFSLPQRYLNGRGALMNGDGTPVPAPVEATQSANGLWYINGQAYAAPPVVGAGEELAPALTAQSISGEQPTVPATPTAGSSIPAITSPSTGESVTTPAPTPAPQPSTRRSRYSRNNDDDDDDDD